MGLRERSQHAKCATCIKYRLLIKKLKQDRRAQVRQQDEYARHLSRQYRDRCVYWASRSLSRQMFGPDGRCTLVIIVDSMDRAKFKFPRSPCMSSKELTSFNRPNVDLTACICHGHSVLLCLAEGTVLKDSSWTCEIICYALDTIAARGILDLRMTDVILQADNATKELKNMTMLRWGSILLSRHRLLSLELRYLQSGHSHEDIDSTLFATIHTALEASAELQEVEDISRVLENVVKKPDFRRQEPQKSVQIVNQVRSWPLGGRPSKKLKQTSYDPDCCTVTFLCYATKPEKRATIVAGRGGGGRGGQGVNFPVGISGKSGS